MKLEEAYAIVDEHGDIVKEWRRFGGGQLLPLIFETKEIAEETLEYEKDRFKKALSPECKELLEGDIAPEIEKFLEYISKCKVKRVKIKILDG